MLYSYGYLFVAFAGLWYSRIIAISHSHINRVIDENKNRFQSLWHLANDRERENTTYEFENSEYESENENSQFFNGYDELNNFLNKEIKKVQELAIWYSSQDIKSNLSSKLFQLLIKLFDDNKDTKTRILLQNIIKADLDYLSKIVKNTPNIEIHPSNNATLKPHLNSSMMIILDKNHLFNITTTNNTDKLDSTFSNRKQKSYFNNQLFEVNWLLSKAR
jgi:hypothetical protein